MDAAQPEQPALPPDKYAIRQAPGVKVWEDAIGTDSIMSITITSTSTSTKE